MRKSQGEEHHHQHRQLQLQLQHQRQHQHQHQHDDDHQRHRHHHRHHHETLVRMSRTTVILRSSSFSFFISKNPCSFLLSFHWCLSYQQGPSCETPSSSDCIYILSHTSRSLILLHCWLNLHTCFSFVCFRIWFQPFLKQYL